MSRALPSGRCRMPADTNPASATADFIVPVVITGTYPGIPPSTISNLPTGGHRPFAVPGRVHGTCHQ